MEVEVEKLERAKENTSTKLMQTEKDLQLALKAEQQAHEEDNERMTKERVNFLDYGKQNVKQNAFHLRDKFNKINLHVLCDFSSELYMSTSFLRD